MSKRYAFLIALVLVTIIGTISYRNKEAYKNRTALPQVEQSTSAADNS